jgi:hypothetical protein
VDAESEAKLYGAGMNRRAERLRSEAVGLALRYRQLVDRHDLDPVIVENDTEAVIAAWQRVRADQDT